MRGNLATIIVLVGLLVAPTVAHSAVFSGPSPYLSSADSPFVAPNGGPFDLGGSDFYLEDFEDGSLNTPGATGNGSVFSAGSTKDSVDADDGVIDGSGSDGKSYVLVVNSDPYIQFTFSPIFSGGSPTHVGLVWTDGDHMVAPVPVTFEAWDESGTSLGVVDAMLGDGTNEGTTAEDRFFGIIHHSGISRVRVTNNENNPNFGIEVDHLQYGRPAPTVPSASSASLAALCVALFAAFAFHHRMGR